MARRIFFHPERCLLCCSCVLACQMQSLGVWDVGEIPRGGKARQRLAITYSRGTPWVWKCQQCVSAPCVETCVSGSLHYGKGWAGVIYDRDICIGCGSCLLACPHQALFLGEEDDRVSKCDLCPEEDVPPCVLACQSRALVYEEPRSFIRDRQREFVRKQRFWSGTEE